VQVQDSEELRRQRSNESGRRYRERRKRKLKELEMELEVLKKQHQRYSDFCLRLQDAYNKVKAALGISISTVA
jgi:hypothetical protein